MRRLLAILLPLLLLVTACSGGTSSGSSATPSAQASVPPSNSEALASVKVVDGGKGKAPKVTFTTPLAIKAESMRIVTDGSGAKISDGQTVELRGIGLDAGNGKVMAENFTATSGGSVTLSNSFKAQYPLVYQQFTSAKVGAFIAYGTPAIPAVAATSSSAAQPAQPASLTVYQITGAKDPAKLMSAEQAKALEKTGGLPTAKFDTKGVPSITIPKKPAPADLAVQVLTEGTGPAIAASDSISANYTGWTWADGKKFDSSYDRGTAATFSLSRVIPGWTMGLTGQKVGSTVILSIPASLAYGDTPGNGQPAGALVFVVKIEAKK